MPTLRRSDTIGAAPRTTAALLAVGLHALFVTVGSPLAADSPDHATPASRDRASQVEGTLLTRGGVPLLVNGLCADVGARIIVRGPLEYCGRGLLHGASGDKHQYFPFIRRVSRISETDWHGVAILDTRLSPSKLLDLVCARGELSNEDSELFRVISRREASVDDADLSIRGLLESTRAACATGASVKDGGTSHAPSGLTVRDDPSGLVVVSWIEPLGACEPEAVGGGIALMSRGPNGEITCVQQVGGAPAARAGVAVGDAVIKIDDRVLDRAADLPSLAGGPSQPVEILMYRGALSTATASAVRNAAATLKCEELPSAGHPFLGGRFYCWTSGAPTSEPATSLPMAEEPSARDHAPPSSQPGRPVRDPPTSEAEPTGAGLQQRYEAILREYGCPSCEDLQHFAADYLSYARGRGCSPSTCDRASFPALPRTSP